MWSSMERTISRRSAVQEWRTCEVEGEREVVVEVERKGEEEEEENERGKKARSFFG